MTKVFVEQPWLHWSVNYLFFQITVFGVTKSWKTFFTKNVSFLTKYLLMVLKAIRFSVLLFVYLICFTDYTMFSMVADGKEPRTAHRGKKSHLHGDSHKTHR